MPDAPDTDAIAQQQELLAMHRRTLAHLLQQAAQYGGKVFAPAATANGIAEARAAIAGCKAALRGWGVPVDDWPDDEVSPTPPASAAATTGGNAGVSRSIDAVPANPFGRAGCITNPGDFYDRADLLRRIFEELGKGINLSLVGPSQIGKSSLLAMISLQGPEHLGLLVETFVTLNLQQIENEDEFYEALCEALGIGTCRGYALVRGLRGRRFIVCLDEIEVINEEGFTIRVRRQLRGLADGAGAPLALVIASRSPLAHLFPDSPERDSPLAGICRQIDVGPFPPSVARAFLAERLAGTGISFTETQIDSLLAASGGHPGRLQDQAARLYRALAEGGS